MGLLERVQKKGVEEPGQVPAPPRLTVAAPAEMPAPAAPSRIAPAAPAGPVRPPLAPTAPGGARTSGATPTSRAAAALVKPTAAQAQVVRLKSRVHARLVEEMQDEDTAEREDLVAKIGQPGNAAPCE